MAALAAALLHLLVCLALAPTHQAAVEAPPPVCQDVIDSTPPLRGKGTRHMAEACKYPVKNFVVLGERNSGTNFLSQLIKENVKAQSVAYLHEYPKHWSQFEYDTRVPKHTLFLLSIRNPYDWLVSMHGQCYCCEKMHEGSLIEFLARPYTVDVGKADCPATEAFGPTGSPIKDMMALRSNKLHMHLHMGMALRPYFVTVRLEDLWCRPNPAAWLQERLSEFCFDWKEDLRSNLTADARVWLGSKFNLKEKFTYSWYFNPQHTCKIHGRDAVPVINKGLHSKLERRMGYSLLQCP